MTEDERMKRVPLIEYRLMSLAVIFSIMVVVTWLVLGVFYQYSLASMLANLVVLVINIVTYVGLKRHWNFILVTTFYFYTVLGILCLAWLPSGGFQGIIPYMVFLVYALAVVIMPKRKLITFAGFCFLTLLFFGFLEINDPDMAPAYLSDARRILDIAIALTISMLMVGLFMFQYKKSYWRDRGRILKYNNELNKEKIRAQSADQAKSQFLTNISHEMRTPLNGIVGISELLSETKLNDEQRKLVENLSSSSHLLHNLISDILDISQIEEGKLALYSKSFNLEETLRKTISIFELNVEEKHLNLRFVHDERISKHVVGDEVRLNQVIVNLVNNAIKFTDSGEVILSTKLLLDEGKSYMIRFTVKDTGAGIPPEHQMKLFDKFYKIRPEGQVIKEGSGLGLAITKNLVNLMGGHINLISSPSLGSSFFFELKLNTIEDTEMSSEAAAYDTAAFKSLSVLIVEDYKVNRLVAIKMLSNLGIEDVDVAEDGLTGLQMATDKCYDLILMDLQMPRMNGFEAAIAILDYYNKEDLKARAPVIIALTANALKEELDRSLAVGMKHFISKPFTSKVLEKAIIDYVV